MKKLLCIALGVILVIPLNIYAINEVTLCQSGCDYNNLDDAIDYAANKTDKSIIYFADDNIYAINKNHEINNTVEFSNHNYNNSININGNNNTLTTNKSFYLSGYTNTINVNNLNITADNVGVYITSYGDITANLENVKISNSSDSMNKMGLILIINKNLSSEAKMQLNINNTKISNYKQAIITQFGNITINVTNSNLEENIHSFLINGKSNVNCSSSKLKTAQVQNGNIYIDKTNKFDSPIIYVTDYPNKNIGELNNNMDPQTVADSFSKYSPEFGYITTYWYDSIQEVEKSQDFGHIYINEEKNINIDIDDYNNDIVIKDLFTEVLNRDIENIQWTYSNEGIVNITDGVLTPLNPGETKITAKIPNTDTTYTINVVVTKTEKKSGVLTTTQKIKLFSVFNDIPGIENISDDQFKVLDPSIAKIINGEIVALKKGETDIVIEINNIKYIYHLVVNESLISKTVEVPITGKKIKAWGYISTILLFGVIFVNSYILIKNKKSN